MNEPGYISNDWQSRKATDAQWERFAKRQREHGRRRRPKDQDNTEHNRRSKEATPARWERFAKR